MSVKALHLNLLNPQESQRASSAHLELVLPIFTGILLGLALIWTIFLGTRVMFVNGSTSSVRGKIEDCARQAAESEALLAKLKDVQAEFDQFTYYKNGRMERGEVLKRLAYAIPETITLTSLTIPPAEPQELMPPAGSNLPPLLGPTQTVESVELRIAGLARTEQDVFTLMNALKGESFTGLVSIVERPQAGERESPRVQAFRQETTPSANGRRDVFFDIVYDLKPRAFVR